MHILARQRTKKGFNKIRVSCKVFDPSEANPVAYLYVYRRVIHPASRDPRPSIDVRAVLYCVWAQFLAPLRSPTLRRIGKHRIHAITKQGGRTTQRKRDAEPKEACENREERKRWIYCNSNSNRRPYRLCCTIIRVSKRFDERIAEDAESQSRFVASFVQDNAG